MSVNQQSKRLQQQKALLDAIESMDIGGEIVEEWQPDEEVAQALFVAEIERERAERPQIVRVSPAPPVRRILAFSNQPLPLIPPNLLMSLTIPEYERKEE